MRKTTTFRFSEETLKLIESERDRLSFLSREAYIESLVKGKPLNQNIENSQTDPFPNCPYRNSTNRCIALKPKIYLLDRNRTVTPYDCICCQETDMKLRTINSAELTPTQLRSIETHRQKEEITTEERLKRKKSNGESWNSYKIANL